jgi:hypothetical protein
MPDAGRPPDPAATFLAGINRMQDVQFDRRMDGAAPGGISVREASTMIGNLRGADGISPEGIRERITAAIADPSNGLSDSDRAHLAQAFNAVDARHGWSTPPIPVPAGG